MITRLLIVILIVTDPTFDKIQKIAGLAWLSQELA